MKRIIRELHFCDGVHLYSLENGTTWLYIDTDLLEEGETEIALGGWEDSIMGLLIEALEMKRKE